MRPASDTFLSPPPHRTQVVDEHGFINPAWLAWLAKEVYPRIGGGTAIALDQLESVVATLPPQRVKPQDLPEPEMQPITDMGSVARQLDELAAKIEAQAPRLDTAAVLQAIENLTAVVSGIVQETGGVVVHRFKNETVNGIKTFTATIPNTFTSTLTSTSIAGPDVTLTADPASGSSAEFLGVRAISKSPATNGQNLTGALIGVHGEMDHYGSGTLTLGVGVRGLAVHQNGSSTCTDLRGGSFQVQNASSGTVTSGAAVYLVDPVNAGTLTTAYGIYADAMTAGATKYVFFSNGAGLFSIGDTTDSTSLATGAFQCKGGGTFSKRLTLDGDSGKTLKYVNPTANGAVAVTFGAVGPTGSTAGNPQGWLRVDVAGTDRYVPFW